MDTTRTPTVRKAWYAGTWYAAEPDSLRSTIIDAIGEVRVHAHAIEEAGSVRMAVLPHAGLTFSARGLAHLVLHALVPIERVLIIAPSHSIMVPEDTLSFGIFNGYETPLGRLEAFRTSLEHHGPDASAAIQREHAVEMVLPYLAYLQEKQDSPIAVAMALLSHVSDATHANRIANQITSELDPEGLLIIASSDFTHYGHRFGHTPYGSRVDSSVIASVKKEDLYIANLMAEGKTRQIFEANRFKNSSICGIAGASVLSVCAAARKLTGYVADYYTSLDVLGGRATDFVAYGTILWR